MKKGQRSAGGKSPGAAREREVEAKRRARTEKARAVRRDKTNAARRLMQMGEVVRLRVEDRKGFTEIATAVGLSIGQVHKLLEEALALDQGQWSVIAERERQEQLAQLDRLERRLLPLVMDETLRVVETKPDGSVMEMEEFERVTKVTDRLMKLYERRSRLLGLDAPVKHQVAPVSNFETLEAIRARLAASRQRTT